MELIWNRCKRHTLKKPAIFTADSDIFLEQWIIPKGTENIKAFETKNFGWIVLPPNVMDKRGFEIPRRIFKY